MQTGPNYTKFMVTKSITTTKSIVTFSQVIHLKNGYTRYDCEFEVYTIRLSSLINLMVCMKILILSTVPPVGGLLLKAIH